MENSITPNLECGVQQNQATVANYNNNDGIMFCPMKYPLVLGGGGSAILSYKCETGLQVNVCLFVCFIGGAGGI